MLVCFALLAITASPEPGLKRPRFSLEDARGRAFTSDVLEGRSAVFVVTAPTVSQGSAQEGWSRSLDPLDWPADGPFYAFLEDLSQSWFKEVALGEIRAKYDPPPWFLIDPTGDLRKALGVPPGTTMVLVFDTHAVLQLVEKAAPSPARARVIWRRALELMNLSASPKPDAGVTR